MYVAEYGAPSQGILISLVSTLLIMVDTWRFIKAPYSAFLGCLIAILGSGIFVIYQRQQVEQLHNIVISVSFRFLDTRTLSVHIWTTGSSLFCSCGDISSGTGIHWRRCFPVFRDGFILPAEPVLQAVPRSSQLPCTRNIEPYSFTDNRQLYSF